MTRPIAHIRLHMKWRALRKALLTSLPWVRRKRHEQLIEQLQQREAALAELLITKQTPAHTAKFSLQIPFSLPITDELCLFVTHVSSRQLKPHVIHHIESLLDNGITVLLIGNTDHLDQPVELPDSLQHRLAGCIMRQNIGYDFAAWAHACSLIDLSHIAKRLYLINDSIVGPLTADLFRSILKQCRHSSADMIGLTENQLPQWHLQSFFLAFNSRLLHSALFHSLVSSVVNLPDKQAVIALYETHLTGVIAKHGYQCSALFRNPYSPLACEDETILNWAGLIERGFPYLKASVIRETTELPTAQSLVPTIFIDSLRKP